MNTNSPLINKIRELLRETINPSHNRMAAETTKPQRTFVLYTKPHLL